MRQRLTRAAAVLAAGALALLGGIVLPSSAQAAASFDTTATVSNLRFEDNSIIDQTDTKLTGEWSLPDHPSGTAGFTLPLPEELHGKPDRFPILTPDTNEPMGTCVTDVSTLTCTFDEAYLKANPLGLHGTFVFWAKSVLNNTTEVTHEFDFKDVAGKVTTTVKPRPVCTENCEFKGMEGRKYGYYQNQADTITWVIEVPAPVGGLNAGSEVVIEDTLGSLQTLLADNPITVQEATTLSVNAQGQQNPDWKDMDPSRYTVSKDPLKISFTAAQGAYYRAFVRVDVADGGHQGTYENSATISTDKSVVKKVHGSVTRYGGSASGLGTNEGRFTVTKKLAGDAEVSADREFTLSYTVTSAAGALLEGNTVSVSAATPFVSKAFPRGSVVHLSEEAPANGGAIEWATPEFTLNDFALVGGEQTNVTLTNSATLRTGTFSAKKVLEGSGAELVPGETTFTLRYAYPAGDGYPAGEGSLELPANGESVTSPRLPLGAVLSLSEDAPSAVDGASWTEAKLSATSLTIAAEPSEASVVTVTNTLEVPPTIPPTTSTPPSTETTTPPPSSETPPSTPATTESTTPPADTTPPGTSVPPETPQLPLTGAGVGPLLIGAGVLLSLGLGFALTARKTRH